MKPKTELDRSADKIGSLLDQVKRKQRVLITQGHFQTGAQGSFLASKLAEQQANSLEKAKQREAKISQIKQNCSFLQNFEVSHNSFKGSMKNAYHKTDPPFSSQNSDKLNDIISQEHNFEEARNPFKLQEKIQRKHEQVRTETSDFYNGEHQPLDTGLFERRRQFAKDDGPLFKTPEDQLKQYRSFENLGKEKKLSNEQSCDKPQLSDREDLRKIKGKI